MIEGLKIDISAQEVKELLEKKAVAHGQKHEFYVTQLKTMEAAIDEAGPRDKAYLSSNNPVEDLKSKVREHREARSLSLFLAAHVVSGETYRLTRQELTTLGVLGATAY